MSIIFVLIPLSFFSIIKPLNDPFSSLAQIIKISAIGEFVIQFFDPLIIYPLSLSTNVVFRELGSEPASLSVKPKQPIYSPLDNFGKYLFFWSSLPKI